MMYWIEPQTDTHIKRRIKICVLLMHALLFWFIAHTTYEQVIRKPPKKLLVRTVKLSPQASKPMEKQIEQQIEQQSAPIVTSPPPALEEEAPAVQQEVKAVEAVVEDTLPFIPPQKAEPQVVSKPLPKPTPKARPVPKKAVPQKKVEPPKAKTPPKTQTANKQAAQKKQNQAKQDQAKQDQAKKDQQRRDQEKKQAEKKQEKQKQEKQKQEEQKSANLANAMASLNRSGATGEKKAVVSAKSGGKAASAPAAIGALSSDALVAVTNEEPGLTGTERTYYDELVRRLKLSLRLPEYGDVQLQLTISRAGKVVKVKCLKSDSKKNIAHVEKTVPTVVFPPFGQNFSNEKEHTFLLRLTKELHY